MKDDVFSQSTFDRVLYNDTKLGAYYTNQIDARLLRNFFKFPEKCCCIDPTCGDGSALVTITGKDKNENSIVTFGVELDSGRCQDSKNNPYMDYTIEADFLQEVRISREVFSFAVLNPPYGESVSNAKERYEKLFFRKLDQYMKTGAFLCYIVPYYIFLEDLNLAKLITNRYDIKSCFKFREFAQFKQVAVIMQKKTANQPNPEMAKSFQDYISDIDNAFVMPDDVPDEHKYIVPASSPDDIKTFESDNVDKGIIELIPGISHVGNWFMEDTVIKDAFGSIGRPPLMPSKSHIYLLATSGFGRGTVGSEDNGDRHLQRGRVIEGQEKTMERLDSGKVVETIRFFKSTLVTILQNDGTIIKLDASGKIA